MHQLYLPTFNNSPLQGKLINIKFPINFKLKISEARVAIGTFFDAVSMQPFSRSVQAISHFSKKKNPVFQK